MSPRFQQIFGTVILVATLATTAAIAAPRLLASTSVVPPAPLPATAAPEPARADFAVATAADGIDMSHWHETGHPKLKPKPASPYETGKEKKDK